MSNPALNKNPAFSGKTMTAEELQQIYDQPSATKYGPNSDADKAAATATAGAAATDMQLGPIPQQRAGEGELAMTYESVITKTGMLFVVLLALGVVGWFFPILMIPGAIAGLVLGLVNAFKKQPNVLLIVLYAAAQGLFLGGFSMFMEQMYTGIVFQAILGTLCVFGVTLLLFRSGKVRTSPKLNKIFMIAIFGYLAFSVVNLILMLTGVVTDPWGLRNGWIGVAIGLLAVLLAAYSLVMDFESIQNGVKNRVPDKWAWYAAFGLMVTLIWLYVEILRIIAILRGN